MLLSRVSSSCKFSCWFITSPMPRTAASMVPLSSAPCPSPPVPSVTPPPAQAPPSPPPSPGSCRHEPGEGLSLAEPLRAEPLRAEPLRAEPQPSLPGILTTLVEGWGPPWVPEKGRWAQRMAQGTVKWFSQDKGYGFITPDEG